MYVGTFNRFVIISFVSVVFDRSSRDVAPRAASATAAGDPYTRMSSHRRHRYVTYSPYRVIHVRAPRRTRVVAACECNFFCQNTRLRNRLYSPPSDPF